MMWIWILFALVFIALLVPLFNRSRGAQTQPPTSSGGQKSAVEILEDRYARGEIGRDEFEKKRRALQR
jgi:putative membrane protein